MESIPEDKIVNVVPEIGVPIAEKLAYVHDDHLAEMYTKLLATASNVDTQGNAHPSFVNVINNLSPDEAQLLEYFVMHDAAPCCWAQAVIPSSGSHSILGGPFLPDELTSSLVFPENVNAYLDNLDGLGLLNIRHDAWLSDPAIYVPIESQHRERLSQLMQNKLEFMDRTLNFQKGAVERTGFGMKFILACHEI